MAGTLTHFLVMKTYLEDKGYNVPWDLEDTNLATAFLGSTGPDIFYMPSAEKYKHIADFNHYKNPGHFVKNLVEGHPNNHLAKYLAKGYLAHME